MLDESIPYRIKRIYASSTEQEKQYLRKILQEIAETGDSQTYRDVWLSDYKEIPVDIDTFLCDDYYLGKTNNNGKAVYPYWRGVFRDIFHSGNKYEEVFFTGATRIGKSSTAVASIAYMLYKLMCLRDPQQYFGKKDISKFSILFFNLTKDLAKGVAFTEFQSTILSSPWFLDHGVVAGSENNPYYIPEGGKISIDFGSAAAHALGQQVFCVAGNTQVLTSEGFKRIDSLVDNPVDVYSYNVQTGFIELQHSEGSKIMKQVNDTIRLDFETGTYVECTTDHKIMMPNGDYKRADELEVSDHVMQLDRSTSRVYLLKIISIIRIYHTEPVTVYDMINVQTNHNFISSSGIVLSNCALMDEINFSQAGVKDVTKAKQRMKDLYNTISARVKGTFRMNGEVYGKIFAVSSKRGDSDFMEAYIQQQLEAGAGDHMYVSDAPQWEVLPSSMFSPGFFYIAVGDRHKKGFVVPDNQTFPEALEDLRSQGYKLLTPPIDMKPEFLADFEIALRDLAGIAVVGSLSFITQEAITSCVNKTRRSPFYTDVIQTGMKDQYTIEEFFHMNEVPTEYKRMPLFIHLDLSITTDRTGIGGVCIAGRNDMKDEDTGKVLSFPTFGHVFSIAIEAPRGDRIPYSKIIAFIKWLRDKGFNIVGISRDTFQSEYVGQLLTEQGFDVKTLSLDRTPDGYIALRSVLLEQRIDMLDVQLLQDELVHLQRDGNTGRVDHPVGGCLVGDTEVRIVGDSFLTIKELVDDFQYKQVLTMNESTGKLESKSIQDAFLTKHVDKIIRIILSNHKEIRCTLDHRFMLSDLSYCEAQYLEVGVAVAPYNYRVESVDILDHECDVYDLTIEDNPNFLLHSGVIVHNSKDVADGFAGAVWNAILTSPSTPVPVKSVAKTMQAINQRRGNNTLPPMFGNFRKF